MSRWILTGTRKIRKSPHLTMYKGWFIWAVPKHQVTFQSQPFSIIIYDAKSVKDAKKKIDSLKKNGWFD